MAEQHEPIAAIPLPSADLINFRFDQQDRNVQEFKKEAGRQFDLLNSKLDMMNATFITRTEVAELQTSADKTHDALWAAIADVKRNARWWFTTSIALLTALSGAIYALTHLHL